MHRHILFFLLVSALGAPSALAGKMTSGADYDQFLNFKAVKTYAWNPAVNEADTPFPAEVHPLLRRVVEEELAKKGLQKVDVAAADVLVNYRIAKEDKTEQVRYNYGRGEHGMDDRTYTAGTLILDLSNPETQRTVWRGWVQAEVLTYATDDQRRARVEEAIRKALKQYPPK
jgi:hypothetical protein